MPKVLSLDKSLDVLEAIFAIPDGIGTRALAKRLDLNVATVHNIATTFCARGYLRQDPKTKAFLPGLRFMVLAKHPALNTSLLTEVVGEVIEDVAHRLNESVMLATMVHHRIINLKYVSSRQALRVTEPEDVTPISYCTAVGKALLASLSAPDLDAYLRETAFERFTPRTVVDAEVLRAEIDEIREKCYARSCDELADGVSALAVPVKAPWGAIVAGIGASAPTVRLQEADQIRDTLRELRSAADQIAKIWSNADSKSPVH